MIRVFTVRQADIKRVIAWRTRRLEEDKKRGLGLHSLTRFDNDKIVRCNKCSLPFQVGDRVVSIPANGGRKSRWWHVFCAEKVGLL